PSGDHRQGPGAALEARIARGRERGRGRATFCSGCRRARSRMTDPITTGEGRTLDPVSADQGESQQGIWVPRLVTFLRVLAGVSLMKGLYHWAIVCGIDAPSALGFDAYSTPFQAATVFFAIIDLVAAVGLWLAAPWGAVVWLTSVISMAAVELLFPQVYGGNIVVVVLEALLLGSYLVLALMAAREQPA